MRADQIYKETGDAREAAAARFQWLDESNVGVHVV